MAEALLPPQTVACRDGVVARTRVITGAEYYLAATRQQQSPNCCQPVGATANWQACHCSVCAVQMWPNFVPGRCQV
jgi:hypothetical protein